MDKKYLKIVNKENPIDREMPEEFDYEDILIRLRGSDITIDDVIVDKDDDGYLAVTFVERESLSAFENFRDYMRRKGIKMVVNEAGRTIEKQRYYRERFEKEMGYEYTDTRVAKPHESEHHTGLALDIAIDPIFIDKFKKPIIKKIIRRLTRPMLYRYMHLKAPNFGYIFRYQKDKQHITGYSEEPWHLRYVGVDYAKDIESGKMSLEEYVAYNNYISSLTENDVVISKNDFLANFNQSKKEHNERNQNTDEMSK